MPGIVRFYTVGGPETLEIEDAHSRQTVDARRCFDSTWQIGGVVVTIP